MRKLSLSILLFFMCATIWAQENLPTDYLPASFHAGRREALRQLMPFNSVAVIFSFPERLFANDVNYRFHQNPDMFYLSGYKETEGVLIIFKEPQQRGDTTYNELMFVRKRNPLHEQWTGRRLGVEGVKSKLGFAQVYNAEEFKNFPVDFTAFSQVLYDNVSDNESGNMAELIKIFREKAGVKAVYDKEVEGDLWRLANNTTAANLANRVKAIKTKMAETSNANYKANPLLLQLVANPDTITLASVASNVKSNPSGPSLYNKLAGTLREIKTPEELVILKKSVRLSAMAHTEVMRAVQPGMSETELEGIHLYMHKKYGAEEEGYPPIVGSGANGCILHYIENNSTNISNQLLLMDVGSEYHNYSADITRTIPSNGKFTPEQKAIYQIVYDAQDSVFQLCKSGVPFGALNQKAIEVIAAGLIKLGIIKDKKEVGSYYPHGCSHHIGLDVHDKNSSRVLQQNMVITVEPGIYIPKGSKCDPKWWDIAVRIEDDVVIGKDSCENLSWEAPRKIEDVEKTIAEKSVLSNFIVPVLK
ncbi:MAG: aminopeptidase P N-terminal domain-containing protein [Bacteroidota bacterium]